MENTSVKELILRKFNTNYAIGEYFFMALKRRKTRLTHFTIDSCPMLDSHLYFFTAFIRSHKRFQYFELTGACFEDNKDAKTVSD